MKFFGRTPINLDGTVFEFKTVVMDLPQQQFFVKGHCRNMVDFGTVIVIDPDVQDQITRKRVKFIEDYMASPKSPLFSAPIGWRMPHVLRALGAFKSATAASKNGWDLDIPEGYSEHQVRIANVKGIICIHKITPENPWFKEVTDDTV